MMPPMVEFAKFGKGFISGGKYTSSFVVKLDFSDIWGGGGCGRVFDACAWECLYREFEEVA